MGREEYRRLRDSGAIMLRHLLDSGVKQFPLTPAARPIFDQMAAQRPRQIAPPIQSPPPSPTFASPSRSPFTTSSPATIPPFTVPIESSTTEQHTILGPQRPTPPPTDLPEPPPPPPDLPEKIQPPPVKPEEPKPELPKRKFDPDTVPIFFNPQSGGTNSPRPPVPPLPPRDKR
jgi:hypothetical protein